MFMLWLRQHQQSDTHFEVTFKERLTLVDAFIAFSAHSCVESMVKDKTQVESR